MIYLYVFLFDLAILAWYVWAKARARNVWPPPRPRPHLCDRCWRAYQTSHLLSLHTQAEHPDPFEEYM
jgi:hypothetical protein